MQRVPRTFVVCVALVGCDAAATKSEPAPIATIAAPAAIPTAPPTPTHASIDKAAPAAEARPAEARAPEPSKPAPPAGKGTSELKQALGRSINDFTIDLQRKLAKQPGNLLVSGMSVSVALAMLHAGSSGATERELAEVLHLDGLTGDVHAALAHLAARWNHPSDHVTLVTAGRVYGDRKYEFKPEYLDLTRKVFGAELGALDFAGDLGGARDLINGWVREQTRAEIGEIVAAETLDAATRLLVTDAATFKADWLEPFDPAATQPVMFYGHEHRQPVPMMRSVQRVSTTLGLAGKLRLVELPYRGGEYSMVILLPATRGGLEDVEKGFDFERLQSWLDAAKPAPVDLQIPRFSLDSNLDLAPFVSRLGAARVFDARRAELGEMASEKKLALSAVRHRARLSVEERGADAPAAPAIEISVGNAATDPLPFIVDRPFIFYVRDVRSGVLLFYGRVVDPA
ncbi:serpin B [Nannocystis exedens]|uniref:Serpin B n=1 Tax=Nannocystis exedens TaxID=54 RepID=A0A1I1ZF74_9BACT|nr:serpin family protein [Nannocystis exedens]PCC74997.1 serine/threonine protein kinase [Nannocystis exedens]SFE30347.1 serpin B [Nannocystis exedens]